MGPHRRTFHLVDLLLPLPAFFCILLLWRTDFLWLEVLLTGTVLLVAAAAGRRLGWTAKPPACCAPLRHWSRNPLLACGFPAVLSVALRIALLPWLSIPQPVVPDEYSHILLAKTFLLGRLTNPPHPLWQHFESIHILSQPTYSSMYMAGQACFLALGKLLAGDLFWGVMLSTALFCAALTWFLRAYVPPGWALFGGILAAVRIGAASYWNDSYWGGSAGALGGALVLGAYPRLVNSWRTGPAIVFALGLVLLANTRPYEGALLGLVLTTALFWTLISDRRAAGKHPGWKPVASSVAVAVVVLGVSGWAMTRHWKAVTGSAFTLPYQINQRMYGWPMTLAWLPRGPAVLYRHREFAQYRDFEELEHQRSTVPAQIPMGLLLKYAVLWRFFVGAGMSAAFLFTSRIVSTRRMRIVWIAGGAVLLAAITEQSSYPHYLSPVAPAVFLFLVQGLRYLAQYRAGQAPAGAAVVRCVIPILCVVVTAHAVIASARRPSDTAANFTSWCCVNVGPRDRQPLVQKLEAIPGQHLVIVHYELSGYQTLEWVYNEANIDQSRIVFARDMGAQKNQELIRYYPGRHVWRVLVNPDLGFVLAPDSGQ